VLPVLESVEVGRANQIVRRDHHVVIFDAGFVVVSCRSFWCDYWRSDGFGNELFRKNLGALAVWRELLVSFPCTSIRIQFQSRTGKPSTLDRTMKKFLADGVEIIVSMVRSCPSMSP
jgi:hypothetical protein